jgi:hypothetical protein
VPPARTALPVVLRRPVLASSVIVLAMQSPPPVFLKWPKFRMRVRAAEMTLEIVTEPLAVRLTEDGPIAVPSAMAHASTATRMHVINRRISCSLS